MTSAKDVALDIIGHDKTGAATASAARNIEKVATKADAMTAKQKRMASSMKVAAAGMVAAAGAAVAFGKKSVDAFQDAAGQTIKLQRTLGGTAEQASRLNFAAEETGVGFDKLSTGTGILSKHLSANDAAWKSLGLSAKDAHGNTKPMADLIPQIADKFAKMPAGPQKTALAMKLFGKQGKDLLPFLNRGAEGIAELGKESDKTGHTMGEKEVAAMKKNIAAKRALSAETSGLEIQVGEKLVPKITLLVGWVLKVVTWFTHLGGATKNIIGVVAGLVAVVAVIVRLTKLWSEVQAAFNIIMDANPIALVIIAIAALVVGIVIAYKKVAWFRDGVNAAFHGIATVVSTVVGFIKKHWALITAILTGPVGAAVVVIGTHWSKVKGFFSGATKFVKSALSGVGSAISAPFTGAFNAIASAWNSTVGRVHFNIPSWVPKLGGDGFSFPTMPTFSGGQSWSSGGDGMHRTGGPSQVNVAAPNVTTEVHIDGVRQIVRQEVRAQLGRTVARARVGVA